MKLYLDKNIAKGTPEELARYKEITSNSNNHSERRLEEVTNGLKPESLNIEVVDDEVGNPDYKKGCFYTITEEARESLLPVGVVLKHQYDRMFDDSQGVRYIITNQDYLKRDNIFDFQDDIIRGRFDFATQLGIRLNTTTDFAVEASDKTFKMKEDDFVFSKGELVKLVKDDKDRLPLFESIKDNRNEFVLIDKVEPTQDNDTEEESPYKEFQVGDRVKVLESEGGAEEVATVTAVYGHGDVVLAGTSKNGTYSEDWGNYTDNLEKVESFEDEGVEEELYDFYEVVDPEYFASSIKKGTILKRTSNIYTAFDEHYIKLVTSKGLGQKGRLRNSVIKPLSGSHIKERFEFAKEVGVILTTNTDFGEECKGSFFKVIKDNEESGSRFDIGDIVKLQYDDDSIMPSFYNEENNQYVYLGAVQEIARPKKDK